MKLTKYQSKFPKVQWRTMDYGGHTMEMPVLEIKGKNPGPTGIVTAGIDGDEYAAIEAGWELTNVLPPHIQNGTVIILPLVNAWGFEAGVSWNPLDGKYPKYIFPGKISGSISSQLMYMLYSTYIQKASCWIDLHAGATNESLKPFVWGYRTGENNIDIKVEKILETVQSSTVIFETKENSKTQHLAHRGVCYLISEAGEKGIVPKDVIAHHKNVVLTACRVLGFTNKGQVQTYPKNWYENVNYFLSQQDGVLIWKNTEEAVICDSNKHIVQKIYTAQKVVLWKRENGPCQTGDVLLSLASHY